MFNSIDWKKIIIGTVASAFFVTLVGLNADLSFLGGDPSAELVPVEFVIQTTQGQPIEGVKIQFIFEGAPESALTNTDGYARVSIPKRKDIDITLTKEEFKTIRRTINLNVENRTRTYQLERTNEQGTSSLAVSTPISCKQTLDYEQFQFSVEDCQLSNQALTLTMLIKNFGKSREIYFYSNGTRIFDYSGNENFANAVSIGDRGWGNSSGTTIPRDTSIKAALKFEDILLENNKIALLEINTSKFGLKFRDLIR